MSKTISEIDASFLEIDQDSLDEEWMSQPELFFKYSTKEARYEKELDEAKSEFDVVKAELDKRLRANPDKYGIKRISENAIEHAMIREAKFQDAEQAVHDAKYKYNIARAARIALDQRKFALESLVKLHGMNYFSNPRADESSKDAVEEIERRSVRKKQAIKRVRDDDEEDE
jgi:hypothetical protein